VLVAVSGAGILALAKVASTGFLPEDDQADGVIEALMTSQVKTSRQGSPASDIRDVF
jgi:hypothetical protein